MRRRGLPDVDHRPVGPAAGAAPRLCVGERVRQGRVAVHRQVEHRFAGGGDLVDVAGGVPGVERPVGRVTECLAPGALAAERGRDRTVEQLLRRGAEIARLVVRAGFVLDLDHDHCVIGVGRS